MEIQLDGISQIFGRYYTTECGEGKVPVSDLNAIIAELSGSQRDEIFMVNALLTHGSLAHNGYVDVRRFLEFLCESQSRSGRDSDLSCKGFNVRQLLLFYEMCCREGHVTELTSTEDVVSKVIIPETCDRLRCYMDSEFMQALGGSQAARRFVCHDLKSSFFSTVMNIVLDATQWSSTDLMSSYCGKGVDVRGLLEKLSEPVLCKTYWMDAFAVHQNGAICYDYSFFLSTMEALVVSLDPSLSALGKVPVVSAIVQAISVLPINFRLAFGLSQPLCAKLSEGSNLMYSVEMTLALDDHDAAKVRSDICIMDGGVEMYDGFINCLLDLSFGRCLRLSRISLPATSAIGSMRHLDMTCDWKGDMVSLSELLGDAGHFHLFKALESLVVTCRKCQKLTFIDSLGKALGHLQTLRSLNLSFENCRQINTIDELGKNIAGLHALSVVRMDFGFCSGLTTICELGKGFSQLSSLCEVELRFASCRRLLSLNELAKGLAASHSALKKMSLSFPSCSGLTSIDELGHSFATLKALNTVNLDFGMCGFTSIDELSKGLATLPELKVSSLRFNACESLTSIDELGKALALFPALTATELDFQHCVGLASIKSIGKGVATLKNLSHASLNFAHCRGLSHHSGLSLTSTLTSLNLNFSGCTGLTALDDLGQEFAAMPSLFSLSLSFEGTWLATIDSLCKGVASLQQLVQLNLDFGNCVNLASIDECGRCLSKLQCLAMLILNFSGCTCLASINDLGRQLATIKALNSVSLNFDKCTGLTPTAMMEEVGKGLAKIQSLSMIRLVGFGLQITSLEQLCGLCDFDNTAQQNGGLH